MPRHNETFEFTLEQLTIGAFLTLPERADDRLVVGLTLIVVIYGILANIALVVAVLGSKELRAMPAFFLLIQIAVCDLVVLFLTIFFRLAGIVFRQAYLGSAYSMLNNILQFFNQWAWWTFVCALTFTAFNRFICIVFNGALFTRRSTIVSIVGTSLLGLAISSTSLTPCCKVLWFFDKSTASYFPMDTWFRHFDFVFTISTIIIIVFCYTGVCWTVSQNQIHMNGKKQRAELRIALQVGLMCGIYSTASILWKVVSYDNATKWFFAAIDAITYIQCAMHPTIDFVFNNRIRKELITRLDLPRNKQRTSFAVHSVAASSRASLPLGG